MSSDIYGATTDRFEFMRTMLRRNSLSSSRLLATGQRFTPAFSARRYVKYTSAWHLMDHGKSSLMMVPHVLHRRAPDPRPRQDASPQGDQAEVPRLKRWEPHRGEAVFGADVRVVPLPAGQEPLAARVVGSCPGGAPRQRRQDQEARKYCGIALGGLATGVAAVRHRATLEHRKIYGPHLRSRHRLDERRAGRRTSRAASLTWTRAHELLDVDVAPTAPTGAPTRTQELRPPPGWGNAECGFYMLRHAPMLTGA